MEGLSHVLPKRQPKCATHSSVPSTDRQGWVMIYDLIRQADLIAALLPVPLFHVPSWNTESQTMEAIEKEGTM